VRKSPLEYLEDLIGFGLHVLYNRHLHSRYGSPGKIVEKASPEAKESLTELKSEEVAKVRFDPHLVMDVEYEERQRQIKERLDFDKKIRKHNG
jgi:hypothetical protein